ncbi:MAG: tetratricopeptide repeat protein [Stigonema ocellatum SAG 48.90 = DSM 106950]|nr:tetratricopeptide repeat protein [Stigonema ocellatum SAG 48.90 = DSM 106950]
MNKKKQFRIISFATIIAVVASMTVLFDTVVLAQTTDTQKEEADSLLEQGNKQLDTSQFEAALRSYQQALRIYQSIKDQLGEGQSLGSLGTVYESLGDYKQAIDYQQQSLAIAREIQDRLGEGQSLGNLGNAYYSLGDYKQAIDYQQQSLAIAREIKDRQGESVSLGSLGNAYYSLGNYKQAIDYQQQSLAIAREIKDRLGEGHSLGSLGNAYYSLGDYKQAINYHQQSLAIARQIKDRVGSGHSLGNLGNAYFSLGDYKQAINYHQQSLAIARQIKDRHGSGQSLGSLGNAYFSLGDYKQAINYHQQSLAIAREIKDRHGEGQSLSNLGLAYDALGDYKQAINYHQQSLAIAREIKDRLGEGQSLNNLGLALVNSGNPQAAETTLRTGINVLESLRADLGDNDALKVSIFETQAGTYRILQKALIAQNQTTQALEIAERGRGRAFIELIAQRQHSSSSAPPNIERIRQIAKQQNATLVEYSMIWDQLYIWVVKPSGEVAFHKVDLKTTNLQSAADAVSFLSCRSNNCLKQIYQLLIQPIAAELPNDPNSHIIFIPNESLFLVPFAALQDQNQQSLIQNHTILIAPSIQVLDFTHQQRLKLQQSASQNSVLVVGNPTMPRVAPRIGDPPQPLEQLPGSENEANIIAGLFNTRPLTGKLATKAAVEKLLAGARIIHLATHGLLDDLGEAGIPGAVALAPSGTDNGLLSANEILGFNLNAELVVLSACDTGRGRITGDGVIGLPRAFIAAGTPSIIVSLWRVSDESTAFLMPEFYRQLQRNHDKANALRQAMLATMKKYPNPSDWAPFILIGEAE